MEAFPAWQGLHRAGNVRCYADDAMSRGGLQRVAAAGCARPIHGRRKQRCLSISSVGVTATCREMPDEPGEKYEDRRASPAKGDGDVEEVAIDFRRPGDRLRRDDAGHVERPACCYGKGRSNHASEVRTGPEQQEDHDG